jgi:hypothetical protein
MMIMFEPRYNLTAVILCLVAIVIPEILLRWANRRPRRSVLVLMTLPVIAGLVLVAYRLLLAVSSVPYVGSTVFGEFAYFVWFAFLACWGGLLVLVVRRLWSSARRRHWWTFGATFAILSVTMAENTWASWSALGPSERLGWDRWYIIPIIGLINTGLIIVAWKLLRLIVVGLWRGFRPVCIRIRQSRTRAVVTEPVS